MNHFIIHDPGYLSSKAIPYPGELQLIPGMHIMNATKKTATKEYMN